MLGLRWQPNGLRRENKGENKLLLVPLIILLLKSFWGCLMVCSLNLLCSIQCLVHYTLLVTVVIILNNFEIQVQQQIGGQWELSYLNYLLVSPPLMQSIHRFVLHLLFIIIIYLYEFAITLFKAGLIIFIIYLPFTICFWSSSI